MHKSNEKNKKEDNEEILPDILVSEGSLGINDQVYLDKLSGLKAQLQQLMDGMHKEYNNKRKDVCSQYNERLSINEAWHIVKMELAEKDFKTETHMSLEEFEEKKCELKENLLLELEEKKRMVEQERYSLDLTGDSMEYKPVSTRKLRRRGNEPQPVVEKRRKTIANSLDAVLEEKDIEEDIRKIFKNKIITVKRNKI